LLISLGFVAGFVGRRVLDILVSVVLKIAINGRVLRGWTRHVCISYKCAVQMIANAFHDGFRTATDWFVPSYRSPDALVVGKMFDAAQAMPVESRSAK